MAKYLTKTKGNMYPWVTHKITHLDGDCPHKCGYCYVDNPRFGRPERFKGLPRMNLDALAEPLGTGRTIFIEHMTDLFSDGIHGDHIIHIFEKCAAYPGNTYIFQTKNPARLVDSLSYVPYEINTFIKANSLFGTTIETNRIIPPSISAAPDTWDRYQAMKKFAGRKFVTIEPVMDFDPDVLAAWLVDINPEFVNIGADSKRHGLPEPSWDKVEKLLARLKAAGIEVREKSNLDRLKKVAV